MARTRLSAFPHLNRKGTVLARPAAKRRKSAAHSASCGKSEKQTSPRGAKEPRPCPRCDASSEQSLGVQQACIRAIRLNVSIRRVLARGSYTRNIAARGTKPLTTISPRCGDPVPLVPARASYLLTPRQVARQNSIPKLLASCKCAFFLARDAEQRIPSNTPRPKNRPDSIAARLSPPLAVRCDQPYRF